VPAWLYRGLGHTKPGQRKGERTGEKTAPGFCLQASAGRAGHRPPTIGGGYRRQKMLSQIAGKER